MYKLLLNRNVWIVGLLLAVWGLISFKKSSKPKPQDVEPATTIFDTSLHPLPYNDYVQYVVSLYKAIDGAGTDVDTIENIFTSISPDDLRLINQIYNSTYENTLAFDLKGDLGFLNGDLIEIIEIMFNQANLQY